MARFRAKSFNAKRRRAVRSEFPVQLSKHDRLQLDADALAARSPSAAVASVRLSRR